MTMTYQQRVQALEAEGLTTSDAQAAVDAEELQQSSEIRVDGTTHPIHQEATGVAVLLRLGSGEIAEVQVAVVRGGLVVIAAGAVDAGHDGRGNARLIVGPTP